MKGKLSRDKTSFQGGFLSPPSDVVGYNSSSGAVHQSSHFFQILKAIEIAGHTGTSNLIFVGDFSFRIWRENNIVDIFSPLHLR